MTYALTPAPSIILLSTIVLNDEPLNVSPHWPYMVHTSPDSLSDLLVFINQIPPLANQTFHIVPSAGDTDVNYIC